MLAALNDDRIGTMPKLESLRRPVHIRLESLKNPKKRSKYQECAAGAVAGAQASSDSACPFTLLANMQKASLLAAQETLETSGSQVRPLVPRHSEAFRKIAERIRLLLVVRQELLARRTEHRQVTASTAMNRLWH